MRMAWRGALAGSLALVMAVSAARAADGTIIGTKASARDWRDKVQAFIRANGIEAAIEAMLDPDSRFGQSKHHMAIERVTDDDRVIVEAHTVFHEIAGMDFTEQRDLEGRRFMQGFLQTVREGGGTALTSNAIPETGGEAHEAECYVEWADGYKGAYFITVCYDRPGTS